MVVGDTSSGLISSFPDVLAASLPGILVALLTFWLTTRRENAQARQGRVNARALLALEISSNADVLRQFWDQIHRLDKDFVPGRPLTDDQLKDHLAAMANGGWVGGYTLPRWSVVRWEGFPATALGGLSGKQLSEIDAVYRDLRGLSDAYDKFMYISPEERVYLDNMGGRFWALRFAEARVEMYKRLDAGVQRILAAKPL
jgi:hypothetical protein